MSVQGIKQFNNHTSRINPTADFYHVPFNVNASQSITPDYHGADLYLNSATPISLTLSAPSDTAAVSSYNNGTNPAAPSVVFNGWEVSYHNIGSASATFVVGTTAVAVVSPGVYGKIKSAFGVYRNFPSSGSGGVSPAGSPGDVQINNGSGGFSGLSLADLLAALPVATTSSKGLVPALPGGTTGFYRADGSFAALQSGNGGGSGNYAVRKRTHLCSATGSVSYVESLGFAPKGVRITMGNSGSENGRYSQGFSDGVTQDCIYRNVSTGLFGKAGYVVVVQDVAGGTQSLAQIVSLDADGCTLNWTEVFSSGPPAGSCDLTFEYF